MSRMVKLKVRLPKEFSGRDAFKVEIGTLDYQGCYSDVSARNRCSRKPMLQ